MKGPELYMHIYWHRRTHTHIYIYIDTYILMHIVLCVYTYKMNLLRIRHMSVNISWYRVEMPTSRQTNVYIYIVLCICYVVYICTDTINYRWRIACFLKGSFGISEPGDEHPNESPQWNPMRSSWNSHEAGLLFLRALLFLRLCLPKRNIKS